MKMHRKKSRASARAASTSKIRILTVLVILTGVFIILLSVYQVLSPNADARGLKASAGSGLVGSGKGDDSSVPEATTPTSTDPKYHFIAPTLEANSAIVMDAKTGKVLYGKNAYTQLPLASITKVMSALIASRVYHATDTITIGNTPLETEGNDLLAPGQRWHYQDLLDFTLVTSSNDGIATIATKAYPAEGDDHFVRLMNKKARELNLSQTFYLNPTGLDSSTSVSGAYSSAHDIADLFRYVENTKPYLLDATIHKTLTVTSLSGETLIGENTNEIVNQIPSLIASKTGYTNLAGGNLAIMYNAGLDHPIIIVVLQSSRKGRLKDIEKLIEATTQALGKKPSESKTNATKSL